MALQLGALREDTDNALDTALRAAKEGLRVEMAKLKRDLKQLKWMVRDARRNFDPGLSDIPSLTAL